MGDFNDQNHSPLRGGKLNFGFFLLQKVGKSRMFKYGLTLDLLSKGQKTTAGGGELHACKG